jgi:hypothetical protein
MIKYNVVERVSISLRLFQRVTCSRVAQLRRLKPTDTEFSPEIELY